jgi:hypothetical protein
VPFSGVFGGMAAFAPPPLDLPIKVMATAPVETRLCFDQNAYLHNLKTIYLHRLFPKVHANSLLHRQITPQIPIKRPGVGVEAF